MEKYYDHINVRLTIVNLIFLALIFIPLNTIDIEKNIPIINMPESQIFIVLWTVWGVLVAILNIVHLILRRWVRATILVDVLLRGLAAAFIASMGLYFPLLDTSISWNYLKWVFIVAGWVLLMLTARRSRYYRSLVVGQEE